MIGASPAAAAQARASGRFDRELREVERRGAEHLWAALERYGSAALEVIDLPPLLQPGAELSAEQIRAAGALLWAREVAEAGLPDFVEALAEKVLQGKMLLPIDSAGDKLMLYRRSSHDRFSPAERRALYDRVFDEGFLDSWKRLLAALDALARAGLLEGRGGLLARAAQAARDVAFRLSQESGGIAAFAARDISEQVRQAVRILRDPEISRALGGGSLWQTLRMNAPVVLGRQVDPELHLDRASAALALTGWLADTAAGLDGGGTPAPTRAALDAAELWLATEPAA